MPVWAFVGLLSGIWKLAIVAVIALVVYGRLGLPRNPWLRLLLPWTSAPARRVAAAPAKPSRLPSWMSDRYFVFFMVLAATALATWIVIRMTVQTSGFTPPGH
jgi:hypothetical protein